MTASTQDILNTMNGVDVEAAKRLAAEILAGDYDVRFEALTGLMVALFPSDEDFDELLIRLQEMVGIMVQAKADQDAEDAQNV